MDRGLRAQLSPNERSTLQLVSRMRQADQEPLRLQDLRQLSALRLIEHLDGGWKLTPMGRARLIGNQRDTH